MRPSIPVALTGELRQLVEQHLNTLAGLTTVAPDEAVEDIKTSSQPGPTSFGLPICPQTEEQQIPLRLREPRIVSQVRW